MPRIKQKSFAILTVLPGAYVIGYLIYTHVWFVPTWIVALVLLARGIRVAIKEFSLKPQ